MARTDDGIEYNEVDLNRALDYARGIHSAPDSAAWARMEDDPSVYQQERKYGPNWARPVCDCKLYDYPHPGCPGPAAKLLPTGWKSGDDLPQAAVPAAPVLTVEQALARFRWPK